MQTNQTFSILFWIKKSRIKNNHAPIYARITIDGRRAEMSIQRTVIADKWDHHAGHMKGRDDESQTLNSYIDMVKGSLQNHYNQLLSLGETITAEAIKNKYYGISEKSKTLIEVFKYHNEQMKSRIDIDFE